MSAHRPFGDGSAPEATTREAVGALRSALRLVDTRTGQLVGVPSDRRVLLRVCVHLLCPAGQVALTDLRAALIGDVLLRTAEVEGLQVVAVLAVPDLDPEQAKVLDRAAVALGVHPPAATIGLGEVGVALQSPADVDVIAEGAEAREAPDGVRIAVGHAREDISMQGFDGNHAVVNGIIRGELDAIAVRLALLSQPYRDPTLLDRRSLNEAGHTLQDWRRHVADWARSPSEPIPDEVRRQAGAAVTSDLDTAAALAVLRRVQSMPGLADGAKFETFAAVDRILGLELTRDVGAG